MQPLSDAEKRVRRIRLLAAELNVKSEINTPHSRERCKRIALELLELLKAEDAASLLGDEGGVAVRTERKRVVGG